MSDLISRQAAIKTAHYPVIEDASYKVVRVDDILALPSAQSEQQWIPCSERLPECNGVYEVTMRCEDGLYESACYFDGQDTWHNDNRVNFDRPFVTDRVIAWMPLPKPYNAESEDKT